MDGLVDKFKGMKVKGVMEKIFYAWKAYRIKQKYVETNEELNVERPRREAL